MYKRQTYGRVVDGLSGGFVFPVQVWLAWGKQAQIELLTGLVELPGGPAKERSPVVWRNWLAVCGIAFWFSPHEPVTLWAVFRGSALFEPFVFGGAMVQDQIHNDLYAKFVGLIDQMETIFIGTVARPNFFIVSNVVAHVFLRRVVEGTDPNGVNSNFLKIAKL